MVSSNQLSLKRRSRCVNVEMTVSEITLETIVGKVRKLIFKIDESASDRFLRDAADVLRDV